MALTALAMVVGHGAMADAVEVNGSARVWAGPIDIDGDEADQEDQRYNIRLYQALTPWLSLLAAYRYTSFQRSFDADPDLERSTREPQLGLVYDRPVFTARLLAQDRRIRASSASQNLDVQSVLGNLEWRPSRGPRATLRLQDSQNTSDASVFGRDTEATTIDLGVLYDRHTWSSQYLFERSKIVNNVSGLRLEQARHELRLAWADSFLDDRWSVSVDARYAQVEQTEEAPEGTPILQPLVARDGLFAVDPSPGAGELETLAGLIDGDLDSPVSPRIEIGGASTFRNIGIDLGVSRPADVLEITVDGPSDPGLIWDIYTSPDNLNWFRRATTVSRFDEGLRQYRIEFDEATSRHFKAVNVSPNSEPLVAVTEIRALVTTDQVGRSEGDGEQYWIDFATTARPHERLEVSVRAGARLDQNLTGTRISRDRDERFAGAQMRIDLYRDLELRLSHGLSFLQEQIDPFLERDETQSVATLQWTPLETVNLRLSASDREERDANELLRSSRTFSLQALTELLPDLRLTSDWSRTAVDDELFGFEQTSWRWSEALEARLTERWRLYGELSLAKYDSTGVVSITERRGAQLRATWLATPYLSFDGDLSWGADDIADNLSQRLSVRWAPGSKLATSLSYRLTEAEGVRTLSSTVASARYRLNRWVSGWLNFTQARTGQTGLTAVETTSLRLGLDVIF